MNSQVIFLVVCLLGFVNATPAIEKEFHRIVNGNECLKSCMLLVRESNVELSIFKRANYSQHLLNLETVCMIIEKARVCIDGCGIQSNPFALDSMQQLCTSQSRQAVKLLEECMTVEGGAVHNECRQQCGDFELMNDEIRMSTAALKPEETSKMAQLMKSTNDACSVLKCHARCSINRFNEQCEPLANGQKAGDMVRRLVEDVLIAQRKDLEAHGLVEAMAQNSQPACNYLYNPQALFDQTKDHSSQHKIMSPLEQKPQESETSLLEVLKRNAQRKLSYTLGELNIQILEKQLEVLNKQERNLDREYEKTSIEIARQMQKQHPIFYRPMF